MDKSYSSSEAYKDGYRDGLKAGQIKGLDQAMSLQPDVSVASKEAKTVALDWWCLINKQKKILKGGAA